jgi:hypothetical protein
MGVLSLGVAAAFVDLVVIQNGKWITTAVVPKICG